MFNINDEVIYTYYKSGIIEKIHYDDSPNLYYTIKLNNLDRYPQTTKENIKLITKRGKTEPFDVNDLILYVKNYNTKIYDIINNKYKIRYKDSYKFVSLDRLSKI